MAVKTPMMVAKIGKRYIETRDALWVSRVFLVQYLVGERSR